MLAIETYGLTKEYGNVKAVDNVDLQIKEGEIFGMLGPNGAGKTTFISMLCTMLKPTSGAAKVNGFDIVKQRDSVRKSIGIVFQEPSLDNNLTGMENLEMHAGLFGVPKSQRAGRIGEVLEIVGLADRAKDLVKNYSGGMKRRLEIARGLIHYPRVLFLDEPTLGLDPQTREHVWKYIKNLASRENITIMLTTHYLEEADSLCDRVAIMDFGKIKVIDKPENLKDNLEGDAITIEVDEPEKLKEKIEKLNGVKKVIASGHKLNITIRDGEKMAPTILDFIRNEGFKTKSISIRKPSLGDVFLHYTGYEIRESSPENNINPMMRMRGH